ncbi:MAG: polyphosphate kinase 2 family protein [Pirellulales bacterium]
MARDKSSPSPSKQEHMLGTIIERCRVKPGRRFRLADRDPGWAGDGDLPKKQRKKFAEKLLSQDISQLAEAQELLYAANSWSVLLIFQAMDAAGKDGTIRHVMSGVNPQGCQVFSFKHPSAEELDHNFLWRCMKALPERGRIGIFNRSYYEEVLIVRVHSELLKAQRIPGAKPTKQLWQSRYQDINHFEQHLTRNGTAVVKFFLNVSKEEQRQRFIERIDNPEKHWKFSAADVAERAFWDDYMQAYERMLAATSTSWAPWYVVPADHKWVTRAMVANIVVDTIRRLKLSRPETTAEDARRIKEARRKLMSE